MEGIYGSAASIETNRKPGAKIIRASSRTNGRRAGQSGRQYAKPRVRRCVRRSGISGQQRKPKDRCLPEMQISADRCQQAGYSFAYLFTCLITMILFGVFLFVLSGVMFISANIHTAKAFGFLGPLGLVFIFFSLPVSILVGFVGRSTIVNGCMNCGHKWTPAKKK